MGAAGNFPVAAQNQNLQLSKNLNYAVVKYKLIRKKYNLIYLTESQRVTTQPALLSVKIMEGVLDL